jgi:arginine decarboxylase
MPASDTISALTSKWTVQDSADLYNINGWGKGFFRVNERGNVAIHPFRDDRCLDMLELIDQMKARGYTTPILFRFNDILAQRLRDLHEAFSNAQTESGYTGGYACIYPIKVNQQSHVVDQYLRHGRPFKFGIEAGSKPELLALLALVSDNETPIICNGFKDDEYIETVILARKIGRNIVPVVEKFSELELIVKYAKLHDVLPRIGVRMKLASRGSGRWEGSSGVRSKFGLTIPEVLRALGYLKERGMEKCLNLLHFHMGSQITNIRSIKSAISEAARIYTELYKAGAGMEIIDVGGGLGVDYDGSQTSFESSVNYTLQEYANDVVYRIKQICDDGEVPHPLILSESGRAIMAYHSVLVFNVLGTSRFDQLPSPDRTRGEMHQTLRELLDLHQTMNVKNFMEHYHDALQARDEAVTAFNLGVISLDERSDVETAFWAICLKAQKIVEGMEHIPEELEGLAELLSDTYFCNFSLFQSMPDSWAIRQLFPIMPIHRLSEEPRRRAVLADITCDSDGKVDQFIDVHDVKKTLELHEYTGEPYYLGAFLVGAYQEILGDLHNLFGDTNAVHVSFDDDAGPRFEHIVEGDTVTEVLGYVQYNVPSLMERMRQTVEKAVRERRITVDESRQLFNFYQSGMNGYTYLEEAPEEHHTLGNSAATNGNGTHPPSLS